MAKYLCNTLKFFFPAKYLPYTVWSSKYGSNIHYVFVCILLQIPSESGVSAKDIEDPDHYSVEDAKQKAEHDRMMKLAEEKKQHARRQIASLRRTFVKLQQKAARLPEHLRLDKEEFAMDPDMERQMKAQAEEKVELVKQQMAWETEKHNIALRKLQKKWAIDQCGSL